jgi:hypothetical protein
MQDDILKLAYEVSGITEKKIHLIDSLMGEARFLAINARIEAARAGSAGVAFGILADEMGNIAGKIVNISAELRSAIDDSTGRLKSAGSEIVRNHQGMRCTDLALNVIELIDRNLYERSCDVRWWATDSAVVEALELAAGDACALACGRLNTILKSYTVYIDLFIANAAGKITACGRPDLHPRLIGQDARNADWFTRAMQTSSGDAYTVADVYESASMNGAQVAIYSTAIRVGGAAKGKALGVLGIAFDWAPQAASIVNGVRLSETERATTRVMMLDAAHRVLAASDGAGLLKETYPLTPSGPSGFYVTQDRLVAYALTPGYETYAGLGWYGVIDTRI